MLELPEFVELPELPVEVWEDSRLSLQSVDSNSSSSGFSELSSDTSEDSEESSLLTSEGDSETVESRPVPSISENTIAMTREPIKRETNTAITCIQ